MYILNNFIMRKYCAKNHQFKYNNNNKYVLHATMQLKNHLYFKKIFKRILKILSYSVLL